MKIIKSALIPFIPASHEDPADPGVLKKILFSAEDLISGKIQMINWAKLLPGKSFRKHYHEDMDEIFIILNGKIALTVDKSENELNAGDAVLVSKNEVHTMKNFGEVSVEYLVLGIAGSKQGKTIIG